MGFQFLIFVTHAFDSQNPLLFRAYRQFDGSKNNYKCFIKQAILKLKICRINISTIVGDNLPVQKSVLDHSCDSMQVENVETSVALPIFSPCICHTLSHALNDFIEKNEDLDSLMTNTSIMTKILRSKPIVSHLNLVCPSGFAIRWTTQFDIFIWVLVHLDKLEKLIQNAAFPELLLHLYS